MTSAIAMTSPSAYQVFQRNGSDQSDITVSGTYDGSSAAIEYSLDGGAWTILDASPSGAFSGTLSNVSAGKHTISVRSTHDPSTTDSVTVGVGDIFMIAGQSNASGRATNSQTYSHATLFAALYGNDYKWHDLSDPTDTSTDQVDAVSNDEANPAGSFIPLLATSIMASTGYPVAFVPCAKGGTTISAWEPGADHSDRSTLYGSMNYRATQVGGARAVLMWIGEADAIAGTAEATFNTSLDTVVNAINTDQSIKTFACKIEDGPSYDESNVNNAIGTSWGDNANALTAPDFSDLTPTGDGGSEYHFKTDAEMSTVAGRWWTAIDNASIL